MQFLLAQNIDNKHMTELWLDQAVMGSAYKSDLLNSKVVTENIEIKRCILATYQ